GAGLLAELPVDAGVGPLGQAAGDAGLHEPAGEVGKAEGEHVDVVVGVALGEAAVGAVAPDPVGQVSGDGPEPDGGGVDRVVRVFVDGLEHVPVVVRIDGDVAVEDQHSGYVGSGELLPGSGHGQPPAAEGMGWLGAV